METPTWGWLLVVLGQLPLSVVGVRLQRAMDPRDRDGRKMPLEPARVAATKRLQAWALAFWGICVLAACVVWVVHDPGMLPWVGLALGLLGAVLGVSTWWGRARAARRLDHDG